MSSLTPKLGYYYSECCLLDLYKIETEEDLSDVLERIEDNDECGDLMVFATLADAIQHLQNDLPPEEEKEQFKRLGWEETPHFFSE